MRYLADRVRALLALTGPLGAGFRILLLRLVARFGWKTVLIGIGVLLYAANRYRTWIPYGLAIACAAAWMHAPKQADEPDDEADEETAGEEPTEPDSEDVCDLVRDLIGDDRGVLLTALPGPLQAADTRAVREALARAGIRVREGVRTATGNGPGVHRDDLPPLPPIEGGAPVGSLTCTNAANTNANNTLRVTSQAGMTIINDPADRHRTHSLKKP
ncbi:hypothetical protein SGFS_065600 [Streptomyces graminofaciens]|uniref:Uncharacterized protein n=1 Tax=Streptomyces graminofaciens TaxID=68212 RepID=A0ABN5VT49_9ACTN|nr:hypothetical protein [Streptomyces graminofaciens]BBC35266.1 hypothetical protein SGFS_065600 [Streptomyces graminofaciens]